MARTTTATQSRSARTSRATAEPEPVGLELAGVALTLGSLLLGAAMATLGSGSGLSNVTGAIGGFAARGLTSAVGIGAWLLPAVGIAWGVTCLRGRRPASWLRAALLLPLLMGLTGVIGALVLERGFLPGLERAGPGGYFGLALGSVAFSAFGKAAGLIGAVAWIAVFRVMTQIDLVQGVMRLAGLIARRGGDVARSATKRSPRTSDDEGGVAVADEEEVYEDEEEYEEEDDEEEDDGEWEYADENGEFPTSELDEACEDEEEDDEEEEDAEEEAPAAKAPAPRPMIAVPPPPPPRKPRVAKPRGEYVAPPLNLLTPGDRVDPEAVREEVEANAEVLEEALASFGVEARVVSHLRGPVITFFEIKVPSGIRLSRVTALADDLAIALKAPSIRIVAPIPGRSTVGIEVPNTTREIVRMRDLLEQESDKTWTVRRSRRARCRRSGAARSSRTWPRRRTS